MKSLILSCLMCALNLFFAQKLLRKVKNWSRLLKPQKLLQKLKGAQTLPNTIGTGLLGIDLTILHL